MGYRYYICDVFTDTRFGGNQLAVLPEAHGLSDQQMQHIAREFNFSESTFVLPPAHGHTRRVRIFTPATEIPFAGHPNVGTAFVLATGGVRPDRRSDHGDLRGDSRPRADHDFPARGPALVRADRARAPVARQERLRGIGRIGRLTGRTRRDHHDA